MIPRGRLKITVDRPLGSFHPDHEDLYYPVNYGYAEGIIAPDGEEQDVYILGVNEPLEVFDGRIIAVIKRKNDIEDKCGSQLPTGRGSQQMRSGKPFGFRKDFLKVR